MGVHEEILREIDEDASVSAENKEPENKILQHKGDAQDQVELLKRAHQRLGGWSKSERSYRDLFSRLERFKLRDAEVGKWSNKNADELGKYHVPREWYLVPGGRKEDVTTKRPGISKAAARRSYGAGLTWNRDEVEVKRARWEGEFVY